MTNLLNALLNIQNYGNNDLRNIHVAADKDQPRVNEAGADFDAFVKDAFCNTFSVKDSLQKMHAYATAFSYLGSQNHPPDIMIKNGDAVEVKKLKSVKGEIPLNSSYPKSKLHASSTLITEECRNCEKWTEKDIIYAVGTVLSQKVRRIIFIYGDCYAARPEVYEKIRQSVITAIGAVKNASPETTELGRFNDVDPLKRTYMRVREMWHIDSPALISSTILKTELKKDLTVFAIMTQRKFETFEKSSIAAVQKELRVEDMKLQDPNDPKKILDCKLISFSF